MNSTVVRIPQSKLTELILARFEKQAADIDGMELPNAKAAAMRFASAVYALWGEPARVTMSDEDALTAMGFIAEAFEAVASDLCEAHFAEEA